VTPAIASPERDEESAVILIPPVGFWRHQRTKTFLYFCQLYGFYQSLSAVQRAGTKVARPESAYRILWWPLIAPAMGVWVVAIFAFAFLTFLWNRDVWRHQICQPPVRVNSAGNHVVVGFEGETWSIPLHPDHWCLRSIGSDWVICHPTVPSDRPFVLIPKKAIPAEWTSKLSEQLKPEPVTAAA
jgi:hypothetical protein